MLILLGILGVVALGRFGDGDAIAARGFFDDTVTAVRFAQKLAIVSGCDARVIVAVDGYELRQSSGCTADDFTDPVDNPANRDQPYRNDKIPDGYSFSTGTITFDARGLAEEGTTTFTLSGGTPLQFRVHGATGLVEVI